MAQQQQQQGGFFSKLFKKGDAAPPPPPYAPPVLGGAPGPSVSSTNISGVSANAAAAGTSPVSPSSNPAVHSPGAGLNVPTGGMFSGMAIKPKTAAAPASTPAGSFTSARGAGGAGSSAAPKATSSGSALAGSPGGDMFADLVRHDPPQHGGESETVPDEGASNSGFSFISAPAAEEAPPATAPTPAAPAEPPAAKGKKAAAKKRTVAVPGRAPRDEDSTESQPSAAATPAAVSAPTAAPTPPVHTSAPTPAAPTVSAPPPDTPPAARKPAASPPAAVPAAASAPNPTVVSSVRPALQDEDAPPESDVGAKLDNYRAALGLLDKKKAEDRRAAVALLRAKGDVVRERSALQTRIAALEAQADVGDEAVFEQLGGLQEALARARDRDLELAARFAQLRQHGGAMRSEEVELHRAFVAEMRALERDQLARLERYRDDRARRLGRERERLTGEGERLARQLGRFELELQLLEDDQREAMGAIATKTQPFQLEKDLWTSKRALVRADIEALLEQLRAKQAEEASYVAKIRDLDEHVQRITGKYQKTLQKINTKRSQLQEQKLRFQSDVDAVLNGGGQLLTRVHTARAHVASMHGHLQAIRRHERISARIVRAAPQPASGAAGKDVFALDSGSDASLATLRTRLAEAQAAHQKAAAADSQATEQARAINAELTTLRAQLPELEAQKKAAVAARNFKDAARLAAELKTHTGTIAARETTLAELQTKADERRALLALHESRAAALEVELAAAQRALDAGRGRQLAARARCLERRLERLTQAQTLRAAAARSRHASNNSGPAPLGVAAAQALEAVRRAEADEEERARAYLAGQIELVQAELDVVKAQLAALPPGSAPLADDVEAPDDPMDPGDAEALALAGAAASSSGTSSPTEEDVGDAIPDEPLRELEDGLIALAASLKAPPTPAEPAAARSKTSANASAGAGAASSSSVSSAAVTHSNPSTSSSSPSSSSNTSLPAASSSSTAVAATSPSVPRASPVSSAAISNAPASASPAPADSPRSEPSPRSSSSEPQSSTNTSIDPEIERASLNSQISTLETRMEALIASGTPEDFIAADEIQQQITTLQGKLALLK